MPIERYTTIAGNVIEYVPSPDEADFLARVVRATNDPNVTEAQLIELVYGRENPILDQRVFAGRGAVTASVIENPIYRVLVDLLDQKRVIDGKLDVAKAAEAYTLSVAEAAQRLDMSPGAVRQAIQAGKLAAWKKGSTYFLEPRSVDTYRSRVARRGPSPASSATERRPSAAPSLSPSDVVPSESVPSGLDGEAPALRARMGSATGFSFRVKAPDLEIVEKDGHARVGVVSKFERAAIAFSGKTVNRFFVLEPADEPFRYDFGPFFIEGRFRVAEKVNNAQEASARFKAFEAR